MTLKEKVAEMEPEKVHSAFVGKVFDCPSAYEYLGDERNATNCGKEICDTVCTNCWNREFVPMEEEKKMTLKEKVQRVSKLCRGQGKCDNCPVEQHSEEIGACTTNIFATESEERLDAMLKCFDGDECWNREYHQKEEKPVDVQELLSDLHALMWMGEGCQICAHCVIEQREPYMKTGCKLKGGCEPLWRGLVDEEEAPGI